MFHHWRIVAQAIGALILGWQPARAWGPKVTLVYTFRAPADGAEPRGPLTIDPAGRLYGTTFSGGPAGNGTVFAIAPDGVKTTLHMFSRATDGAGPDSSLVFDAAGNLYGSTVDGGRFGGGTVFRIAPDGTENVLYAFTGGADGRNPSGNLAIDPVGTLYGTTARGGAFDFGTVFAVSSAGTPTVLHSFAGLDDGIDPVGGVTIDPAGDLFGTASEAGAGGLGVLFEVAAGGEFHVLHTFTGPDGALPQSPLLLDAQGDLFGTTTNGGADFLSGLRDGQGTVFARYADGRFATLYSFRADEGNRPWAGLVQDASGNLYGTTLLGGPRSCGSIFRITPAGQEEVLHVFENAARGCQPAAGLIPDGNGDYYGSTEGFARNASGVRYGTIIRLRP